MTSVAIVVLNYNGRHYLEQFLPTLIECSQPFEVIVADNASTDDSVGYLKEHFQTLRLIELPNNEGFAGGYNNALQQLDHEYFILINSDVEVTNGWSKPLIDFLEKNTHYAACQPKIKSYSDRRMFEYAGAAGGYLDFLGYPFCKGRVFDVLEEDQGQYDKETDIFWSSGACMAIRSKIFFKAGGFDQDFFAHMEEIDLCWRIHLLGFAIAYIPTSTVYHVGGGTLSRSNPKKTYLNFRNSLSVVTKNLPLRMVPIVILLRMILDVLAGLVFLKTNSTAHFRAVLGAQRDFVFSLGKTLRKRRNIQRTSAVQLTNKSIVWNYFVLKRKTFKDLFQ